MTNETIINYNTAIRMVEMAMEIDRPLFLFGPPGNGKTALGYEMERRHPGLVYFPVNVSQMDTLDFRGLPDLNSDSEYTVWRIPEMFAKVNALAEKPGTNTVLLGLDEISGALDDTHGVLYQMVQTRRVGPHKLDDKVRFICMGNLPKHGSGIDRRPNPIMVNRGLVAELEGIEPKVWLEWAAREQINPIVRTVIRESPGVLNIKSDKHLAIATPRSWETASRAMDVMIGKDLSMVNSKDTSRAFWETNGVIAALVACVGPEAVSKAVGVLAFVGQLPPIEVIERDGAKAQKPTKRIAAALAAGTLSLHVLESKEPLNILSYMQAVAEEHGDDILSLFMTDMINTGGFSKMFSNPATAEAFIKLASSLGLSMGDIK